MKLYSNGLGKWVGTQADAKPIGADQTEVPTDKPSLLEWLNSIEAGAVRSEEKITPTTERHPQSCSANDVSGYDVTDVVLNCDRKHLGKALAAIISRLHDEVGAV